MSLHEQESRKMSFRDFAYQVSAKIQENPQYDPRPELEVFDDATQSELGLADLVTEIENIANFQREIGKSRECFDHRASARRIQEMCVSEE